MSQVPRMRHSPSHWISVKHYNDPSPFHLPLPNWEGLSSLAGVLPVWAAWKTLADTETKSHGNRWVPHPRGTYSQ
jgi:hypothetical protein